MVHHSPQVEESFNEAAFLRTRKAAAWLCGRDGIRGFNEAAFLRTRKGILDVPNSWNAPASMRPRSYERGKMIKDGYKEVSERLQ